MTRPSQDLKEQDTGADTGSSPETALADPAIRVTDHPERGRYEVAFDEHLAGVAEYTLDADIITLDHTEIDPAFSGHGLGVRLITEVLDDTRRRGRTMVPACLFTARFIRIHPEYQDLVVETP